MHLLAVLQSIVGCPGALQVGGGVSGGVADGSRAKEPVTRGEIGEIRSQRRIDFEGEDLEVVSLEFE